jgi:hypothetical protein
MLAQRAAAAAQFQRSRCLCLYCLDARSVATGLLRAPNKMNSQSRVAEAERREAPVLQARRGFEDSAPATLKFILLEALSP